MKQTAVEWLVNEMPVIDWADPYWKVKLEQAKAMEKEQMEDAWYAGDEDGAIHEFENYYNETFKQDK